MTVLSVQKHTLTLGAGVNTTQADLTGTPASDTSNCVPFTMTRITAISSNNPDAFSDYLVNTDFVILRPALLAGEGPAGDLCNDLVPQF
jgi:hypothetical protein